MRRRHVLLVGGLVAFVAAAASLFGGVLAGSHAASPAGTPAAAAFSGRLPSLPPAADTAGVIRKLQAKLRARPDDADSLTLLGIEYEQRARETGDPSYYPKAAGVLQDALRLAPDSPLAESGLASLSLSRHRFRDGLALGRTALEWAVEAGAPKALTSRDWGVIGDAQIELGQYKQAFAAFGRMMELEPGLAAYARISYARELLGRPRAAIAPMKAAVDASVGQPEPLAWTKVQLGKLYWSMGETGRAEREYRTALMAFPGYVYALDALALVEAAHHRYARAIALERRAVNRIPLPQFVVDLGDLYRISGHPVAAQRQYALMDVIRRLLNANGVKTDLEIALFQVDHSIRLPGALRLAFLAHRDRPSIDGDDVLAWALARNGRCAEALGYSKHALRLGTKDAVKFFHRGMIERCLGHRDASKAWLRRALATNPHFSLIWAPVARRLSW